MFKIRQWDLMHHTNDPLGRTVPCGKLWARFRDKDTVQPFVTVKNGHLEEESTKHSRLLNPS
jgi:hypothetical protein